MHGEEMIPFEVDSSTGKIWFINNLHLLVNIVLEQKKNLQIGLIS